MFLKLREREKGIVKDRFKGFNAEIEDIVTKHQRYLSIALRQGGGGDLQLATIGHSALLHPSNDNF